ncbi:CDP-glycerol glycerophosphotransferase family protein [Hansschlegelia beijingensis]
MRVRSRSAEPIISRWAVACSASVTHHRALVDAGIGRKKSNDWRGAASSFARSLTVGPISPSVLYELGYCLLKLELVADALCVLEAAERAGYALPRLSYHTARALHQMGRLTDAAARYQSAYESSSPHRVRYRSGLITLMADLGRGEEAARIYLEVFNESPEYAIRQWEGLRPHFRTLCGMRLPLAKNEGGGTAAEYQEMSSTSADELDSVEMFRGLALLDSAEPRWWDSLALALRKRKKWDEAIDAHLQAIRRYGQVPAAAYISMATCHRRARRIWPAIEALEQATTVDPGLPEAWFALGSLWEELGSPAEAAAAYQEAVDLKPNNAEYQFCTWVALRASGQSNEHVQYLERAISLDPAGEELGAGLFFMRRKEFAAAAAAFTEQISRRGEAVPLLLARAEAHEMAMNSREAANDLRVLISSALETQHDRTSKPETVALYFRLGVNLERCGDDLGALEAYRGAIRGGPGDDLSARHRLGLVLKRLGRYEEGARSWLGLDPSVARVPFQGTGHSSGAGPLASSRPGDVASDEIAIDFGRNAPPSSRKGGPAPWTEIGAAAEGAGDHELAVEAYKKAADRSNDLHSDIYMKLGRSLFYAGRAEEACEAFANSAALREPYLEAYLGSVKDNDRRRVAEYLEYRDLLPLKDAVLYESFGGALIGCNPLAIFKALVGDGAFESFHHYLVVRDDVNVDEYFSNLDNATVVRRESDLYLRILASAKYLINNSTFPSYFIRRDGQKYLNTWHGTPLKLLGRRMRGRFMEHKNGARNLVQATHIISPNSHTTKALIEDFGISGLEHGCLAEIGSPRNDVLIGKDEGRRRAILSRLGATAERPLAFYAPTWRGTHDAVELDIQATERALQRIAEAGFDVRYRVHPLIQSRLPIDGRVPDGVDSSEVLAVTDVLVTDYSSLAVDYKLTGKALIFYVYDLEEYQERRGLYINPSELPGELATTEEELAEALTLARTGRLIERSSKETARWIARDDGEATSRAVEFFFRDAVPPECPVLRPDRRKRMLFYVGPFMANGITSSWLNLVGAIDRSKYRVTLVVEPDAIGKTPERAALLSRLPGEVDVFARVGVFSAKADEKYATDLTMRLHRYESQPCVEKHEHALRREFERTFGKTKFDIIINYEGYQVFWAKMLALGSSSAKIIYLHNDMGREMRSKFPYLKLTFDSYSNYDKLICVSVASKESNIDALSLSYGQPPSKFVVCPNLVGAESIRGRAEGVLDEDLVPWLEGGRTFVTVGRLSPEKGHRKLLRAFAELRMQSADARLVIVGDGPLRLSLEREARELGLDDDAVKFAGLRMNPHPVIRAAGCFVLPSDHEGQPVTLLEALVHQRPIVATDLPENRDVLRDTGACLVPNSVGGVRNGMDEFLLGRIGKTVFDPARYERQAVRAFEEACRDLAGPEESEGGGAGPEQWLSGGMAMGYVEQ